MRAKLALAGWALTVAAFIAASAVLTPTTARYTDSQAIGANAFTATAAYCTTPPTLVYLTGMEHAVTSITGAALFNETDASGGSITADTAVKRSGNYSLKIVDSGSSYS